MRRMDNNSNPAKTVVEEPIIVAGYTRDGTLVATHADGYTPAEILLIMERMMLQIKGQAPLPRHEHKLQVIPGSAMNRLGKIN